MVFPQAMDKFALVVTVFAEAFFEELLGQEASLWEALHVFPDFDVDVTILGVFVTEVVELNYFLWDVA